MAFVNHHLYFYGKVYLPDGTFDEDFLEIYCNSKPDLNSAKGLEGIFASFKPMIEDVKTINPDWKCRIKRPQMEGIEIKYRGMFFPFEEQE